jgi:putative membrane-bound dehydrogenase-like protein
MNSLKSRLFLTATILVVLTGLMAYQSNLPSRVHSGAPDTLYDQLSDEQKRSPRFALSGLTVASGVQAALFASEPTVANPTVLDVDHKGRVWVCEANNYRPAITGRAANPAGDRVLILEDTDGDGVSDKTTVFYQDAELNAPIGLWANGNRAIVSQSPYVWLLTDLDGDDKADKKEVIFSGIEGEQHDHGIHSFVMGPDGKFYFAVGNEGKQLLGKNGEPLKDYKGRLIDFKKYKQGLLLRCDEDFNNLEVLGHNFRNNYEPAIDSYGNIYQSDNDDDGNRGVRINFILENGNYGYTDELTGAGWRVKRTNQEDSIPLRHWHLNDPGVVPNLLQTGAGSPTGLLFYEGDLLPAPFRNQMIHCDAGPNAVRAYPLSKSGAGFTATMVNLLQGSKDQWFRPSDVATAPDGSVFVSDWYDPGVGGHQMGDTTRGRIYRLAPKATVYQKPTFDFTSVEGAIKALANPNPSVRHMAFKALSAHPNRSIEPLTKLFDAPGTDAPLRARAFWILSKMVPANDPIWERAASHADPRIRTTTLRAARQVQRDNGKLWLRLAEDPDAHVRREVAISLFDQKGPDVTAAFVKLANSYPAGDRWYLEALGIAAANNWDDLFLAWADAATPEQIDAQTGRDIVWRARSARSVPYLAKLASDETVPLKDRLRYFRAFDFNPGKNEKSEALMLLLNNKGGDQKEIHQLVLRHLDPEFVRHQPQAMSALQTLLDATYGTEEYLNLVKRFEPISENQRLLDLALSKPYDPLGRSAAAQLLQQNGLSLIEQIISGADGERKSAVFAAIARVGSEPTLKLLSNAGLNANEPMPLRRSAIRAVAGSNKGEDLLLGFLKNGTLSGELKAVAIQSLSNTWRKSVRKEAAGYLDAGSGVGRKHPPVKELVARRGKVESGKKLFTQYCALCHQVGSEGADFGPGLSEIGDKLSKEGQYLALYYPSAGISFGYEGYEVKLKDGTVTAGIILSKTETDLLLKFPGGATQEYKMANVTSLKQMDESMMTAGLHEAMSTDELVDLVEYLTSLKK